MYAEKWWTPLEYRSVVIIVTTLFLVEIEKQQYETASTVDVTTASASDSTAACLHVVSLESTDDRTRSDLILFVAAISSTNDSETHSSRWATLVSTNQKRDSKNRWE